MSDDNTQHEPLEEPEDWRAISNILFDMNPKQNLTILGAQDGIEIIRRLHEKGIVLMREVKDDQR